MTRFNTAVPVALAALMALSGCSSSPRLNERRSGADDAAEALNRLAEQRAEARRLSAQAEQAEANDPDRAIELYRRALSLDDTLQNAWNNLGTLLMDRGLYADAVGAFQRASQLVPNDPRPEYNIGIAYQRNGWGEEAFRHFANAIDRDASHLPSMRGYVRAAEMTGRADNRLLEVIQRATLMETDAAWKDYLLRQRYRVEAIMDRG